jgi:DNA invertase Pin-like site-specific DNA recombinase
MQQETDGSGNKSQEVRCREYASSKNYPVEMVFKDTFSGGGDFMDRPAMRSLLNYLDTNQTKEKEYVIIFDDLKRFARDTEFHIRLRTTFKKYKVAFWEENP